jgi:hypothetical protein
MKDTWLKKYIEQMSLSCPVKPAPMWRFELIGTKFTLLRSVLQDTVFDSHKTYLVLAMPNS